MDAIVLAGGKSLDDPLAELTKGELKSMLPIAGKPMVQWILDAISGSQLIDYVALVGIEDISKVHCTKPIIALPDAGSIINNLQQASIKLNEIHPDQTHVMSFSGDIPAINSEIIDGIVALYQKGEYDIYYGVVEKSVMEKRYPGSKRTYVKVKHDQVCGSDVNCFRKSVALSPNAVWKQLVETRKNPLKQAAIIGIDTLLLLLLGRLDLETLVERVCRNLKITGKAVRLPFAEAGMDVDKPFQFEIVQEDLLR